MSSMSDSGHLPDSRRSRFDVMNQDVDPQCLRATLRDFFIAIEQSPVATAITDGDGRMEFVNRQFLAVTGYSEEELLGRTPAVIQSGLTPPTVYEEMWRLLRAGKVWQGELLNRKKNGELYWEAETITPVKDDQGRVIKYVVVKEDVTARKERDAELRLLATVFETGQATLITDAEMSIERVNRAFSEITGYTAEEVIGLTPRIFKSGMHDAAFYRDLWDALLVAGHWQGEIWNRKKDGEIYPLWESITAVHDEKGNIRNFVAVFHDIAERKRIEQELKTRASRDHLTGALNRRAFDEVLRDLVRHGGSTGEAFSLLIFDIDHFKAVNDAFGHEVGDRLLKDLAGAVMERLRKSDLLVRWGGEEFTILLPHTPLAGAERFAERLRRRIARTRFQDCKVTISMGLCQYQPGDSHESLMARADEALYRAKREGRNRLVLGDRPTA